MVKSNYKNFLPSLAHLERVMFDDTNSATIQSLFTAGSEDSLIYQISIYNSDSSDNLINFGFEYQGVYYPFEQYKVLGLAGADGNTPINHAQAIEALGARKDSNDNFYFLIPAGWSLTGVLVNPPSTGTQIVILTHGEDYS